MPSSEIEIISPDPIYLKADECQQKIQALKHALMESSLILGNLLKEFRDNRYAQALGYPRFDDWVETASGLDMSSRQAFYLIAVVERSKALGIPDEELHKVKLSKLKTIFSLPETTDPEVVKSLVREAEDDSLNTVQEKVGKLKDQDFVVKTLKLERTVYENLWIPAVERARMEYGNTIDQQGNLADISDARAFEVILADYLSNPSPYEEGEVLEAEYEDILEAA